MTTYIFFDEALHILVKAFLASTIFLLAVSGFSLAVVNTIEKTNLGNQCSKNFR